MGFLIVLFFFTYKLCIYFREKIYREFVVDFFIAKLYAVELSSYENCNEVGKKQV